MMQPSQFIFSNLNKSKKNRLLSIPQGKKVLIRIELDLVIPEKFSFKIGSGELMRIIEQKYKFYTLNSGKNQLNKSGSGDFINLAVYLSKAPPVPVISRFNIEENFSQNSYNLFNHPHYVILVDHKLKVKSQKFVNRKSKIFLC